MATTITRDVTTRNLLFAQKGKLKLIPLPLEKA
jgi:hypothetical protein